jgi:hypothetical protein
MTLDTGPSLSPEAPAQLTLADFEPRVGSAFVAETEAGPYQLTLFAAQAIPNSPRAGGGFRLEFSSTTQPILPQAIYAFSSDGFEEEIFIVPLGPAPTGDFRYEAVFF